MSDQNPNISQLQEVFDKYNVVAAEGKIEEALKFRSAKINEGAVEFMKDEEGKNMTLSMMKSMAPVSYVVDHVDNKKSGEVSVNCTGTFISGDPDDHGKKVRVEFELIFLQENDAWKLGDFILHNDPDKIERSANQSFESEDNYDAGANTSMGGRVISVTFDIDHTMVVVRVTNQEVLVTLPNKEALEKAGFTTDQLAPWSYIEVTGYPHKTDSLKVWGTCSIYD
ncbi:hypothetical protein IT413_05870 [Candidatus Peregrinibacteria bacterium]|nr:hypothetical protein [Candidatus Peregrinibacteria bacterium]